ncbi:hypothetical protein RJ639_027517 [Escallonia herrerae]|uniref:MSP domain-containing protein n=1 Tax=Escallonia herrerae TaxID=1293975 RepID=A0AA89BJL5_9ASTE|nr:hypothetical protein RJ639_027517 [Escallonia herrerae]
MSAQLLEIRPCQLKFTFEVKKQSSCAVHLANVSDQYVAFKVKTTSPKRYCVRPNIGVINPRSTCDFTVTMQAQRSAPADMHCKDKFLVQSTVVPFGTTEEDISPGVVRFAKDRGIYIEGNKLKVVLISRPHSPVLLLSNNISKQEPFYETSIERHKSLRGVENVPPPLLLDKDVEDVKSSTTMEEPRLAKIVEVKEGIPAKKVNVKAIQLDKDIEGVNCSTALRNTKSAKIVEEKEVSPVQDAVFGPSEGVEPIPIKDVELREVKDMERTDLELTKEFEDLKSKLNFLNLKLIEAKNTVSRLKEKESRSMQEQELLKQELAVLREHTAVKGVQIGFPFLCGFIAKNLVAFAEAGCNITEGFPSGNCIFALFVLVIPLVRSQEVEDKKRE